MGQVTEQTPGTADPAQSLAAQYEVETAADAQSAGATTAPAVPAPIPEPPKSPSFQHPAYLSRMAADLGWTQEEIASTPTDSLGDVVARVQAHSRRTANETQRQSLPEPNRPLPPQQQLQPPPPAPAQDDFGLAELGEFAPEVSGSLKKVVDGFQKKVANLESHIADLMRFRDQTAAQAQAQLNNQIDTIIGNLGPQFAPHFGKGPGHAVQAKDPVAWDNRLALIHIADTISRRGVPIEEAFRRAARSFMADAPASPTPAPEAPAKEQPLTEEQRRWNEAGSAVPTHRQPPPEPPGKERATKNLTRRLNEAGIATPSPNGVQTEETGFASNEDFPE